MNEEERKAYNKKYYKEHKEEHREEKKVYNKKYREEHKEEQKKYREEHKEDHKKRQKERIRIFKKFCVEYKGSKCNCCGLKTDQLEVYDFHHLNRDEKEFSVGKMCHADKQMVIKELDKCILVCSNCHRTIEYERGYDLEQVVDE
jgi:hypothetical protein